MSIEALFAQFLALGGVASVVSMLVNFGKAFGIVKDGDALNWTTGLNLVGLCLLFVAHLAGVTDFGQIDQSLATVAQLGALVLALVLQVGVSRLTHVFVRGAELFKLPIGFSHTLNG